MAKAPNKKTAGPKSSVFQQVKDGASAAVMAVMELISPKFKQVDNALLEHGEQLSRHDKRFDEIEARVERFENPILLDQLAADLVQEHQAQWAKLLN